MNYSGATGISADGSTVVGRSGAAAGMEAFRWTAGGGMTGLGDLPDGGTESSASGISADGSVIVGYASTGLGIEAFRWTPGGGMTGLGDLLGGLYDSGAEAVSGDGNVIVGYGNTDLGYEAFRWTESGGMVGLGDLPGGDHYSVASGVSFAGNVVVGFGSTAAGTEAFVWTPGLGMVSMMDRLAALGTDLSGWNALKAAYGVSYDGSQVVGYGLYHGVPTAFVADITVHAPEPSTWAAIGVSGAAMIGVLWRRARGQGATIRT